MKSFKNKFIYIFIISIFIIFILILFLVLKKEGVIDNFDTLKNKFTIVEKIHDNLFKNFDKSTEKSERIGIIRNLKPTDVVLEIGGNIGGVSEVIASIVNPNNFVVVEPSFLACKHLKDHLRNKTKKNFHIFNGVIYDGINKIECSQPNKLKDYCSCKITNSPKNTNNKTFNEIQNLYNLNFNVLVIDCEGCYTSFFKYLKDKNMLKNIEKIFIEWDGEFMEDFLEKNGFLLIDYIDHGSLENGVRTYLNSNYNK